jgi:ketol-acid reductoisomerase
MMRLTIVGFGNQAKSWAQNLKDSGFPVRVALRAGSASAHTATSLGVEVVDLESEEFTQDQAFALLIPDTDQAEFLKTHAHRMKAGSRILYAHGFSLLENKLQEKFPKLEHILFAPKSIGTELRVQYLNKGKLGAVYSFEHLRADKAEVQSWLFSLSKALGINLGPYQTSFERETQADLYSEQGLLCSLIPYTAERMFDHLVQEGTEPELAYFECWLEMKLIINAMVDKGPQGFFDLISPNALIGSEKGFERLMTPEFDQKLRSLLTEIRSGEFNRELEKTDVEETRQKIRSRWEKTPLMHTFRKIQQDTHEKN